MRSAHSDSTTIFRNFRRLLPILVVSTLLATPAAALSELGTGRPDPAASDSPVEPSDGPSSMPTPGGLGIPSPDPLIGSPETDMPDEPSADAPVEVDDSTPLEVLRDIDSAPEPVRRMRQLMIEAASSGDVSRLRGLLNPGPNQTQVLSPGDDSDPVEQLKSLSGDSEGVEILAIMIDILSTGFVRRDAGTPDEVYVWPYFAEKSITTLSGPEKVDLLRIVTAGDFASMLEYGNYNFFRIGISPDGQWKFFTGGD